MSAVQIDALLRDAPLPLIASRIRRARRSLGLSHDRLGELMEPPAPRQQLIKLEQGKNRPRLSTLERIAEATGRSIDWFLDPEVDPSPFPEDGEGLDG